MRKTLLMTTAAAALLMLPAAAFAGSSQGQYSPNSQAMSGANDTARHRTDATDTQGDRATAALNLLEEKGYTQFSNFHRAGSDFQATVTRDGHPMVVAIDPDSGSISQQTAAAGNPSTGNGYAGSSTAPATQNGGTSSHGGSWANQPSGSSGKAAQTYHDFYNPEGGSPPTGGVEGSAAKKH
jgi:hypothetical protein